MTHLVSLDTLSAIAGYVRREYGDYGYRAGIECAGYGYKTVALVRHSDGSEFRLLVDHYGNVELPAQCNRGTIGCAEESYLHNCA